MLRVPALILLLVLALAVPGSAFAQNAGDDQYQDPFGDAPAQSDDDGGLSETPPGGGGSGGGEAGTSGDVPAPAPAPEAAPPTAAAAPSSALPNTGSDARLLALLGLSMLMVGVGLRLRTIHPDAY